MYLVAIAWLYVVVMMALAEALSPQGSVLGAVFTLLMYGVLPVVVVLYMMGAPHRRRARLAAENAERTAHVEQVGREAAGGDVEGASSQAENDRPEGNAPATGASGAAPPDGGGEPPGHLVAPVRKEA